ncbi:hemagglutinin repeat protein [Dyella terrae]|nr:hemagglutinin repeat protein [Dyella terrae]
MSVQAGRDIVSTGAITSTGDMALLTGRDLTVGSAPVQSGGNLAMVAGHDLTATASHISAGGNAQLVAGNDINLDATVHTTRTGGASNGQETTTHAVTDITAGGNLALVAGNDLTSVGAQLKAGNRLGLSAGHDITLNAVTDSQANYSKSAGGSTVSTTRSDDDTVRGSTLSGANGVSLVAKNDLTATAASISSTNGGVGLMAGHDLTLNTAQENHSTVTDTKTTNSGMLSSTTKRTHDSVSDSLAMGTTLSGDSVSMAAGHDLTATAAQIVADHDIVMAAGNNLTLNTANDVHTEEHGTSKTKSGLMGAGVGVMLGEAKQSQDATLTQTTPTGTTVGSLGGSVTMTAGNTVHLTDANVLSDTGTVIVGKNVTIDAALGTTDTTQTQKQSSSGLTLSLGGAAVSAAQGVYAAAHRGSEVKDDRLKALYAAQAAYGVSDTIGAAQGGVSKSGTDGGINLQLGIGASSASSKTVTHDETAYGSTIHSNGNVVIAATGGDLNVIGSQISGDNVGLMAANNINLLSQAEDHTLKNTNKNASGGVGVQIGTDGIGFYAQASVGKGSAHGNGTTHVTTSVDAKNTLTLVSGGDTTIQGAQAKGNTVLADIGGNLNIRSEQDTNDYASKQQQASGKVVVGVGASGSGSYNQSNIDSHYASVTTVSGIDAGDGGFNIHVNGNTDLKGGVIASTADASKNLLDTGSLTFSDIENKAKYSASSVGISGGSSGSGVAVSPSIGIPQGDNSHNTTKAGVADGTIVVRDGNADLSGLDRTATLDQQGLKSIFDLQKVQEQQEMGQVAGYVGMRTAGTVADYMAHHAATDEEQTSWKDGGTNKVLLHGLVGAGTAALGGGDIAGGTIGAAASEAASGAMQKYLDDQHITDPAQRNTFMNLASAAIGGAVGGGAGATTALQGEQFNRQLHPDEKVWIKTHAAEYAAEHPGMTEDQAMQALAQQAARQTDVLWAAALPGDDSDARLFLASAKGTFTNDLGGAQKLFTAEGNQFLQPMMYLPEASADRGFYQRYVQPGAGNINTGLQAMLAQAGINAYMNQGQTAWNVITGALTGIGGAVLHPVDTFNSAGQDLGNNAVYTFNAGLIDNQFQAVYGQDVSKAATTLTALNTSLTFLAVTGAGKGAAAAIEGAAKSATTDALIAAVKAGASGDAAGLEKFTQSIVGKAGFAADGTPLMDFRSLTNAQKSVVAELLGGDSLQQLVPDATKIGRSPGIGQNGIDDLYKVNRPDVDYVVVEYKFGSSALGQTADGLQMSDNWLTGANTNYNRILESTGNEAVADSVSTSLQQGRVERWVVNTDPFGNVSVGVVDKSGKFIPNPQGASKILRGNQ